jgi:hypothetical protein
MIRHGQCPAPADQDWHFDQAADGDRWRSWRGGRAELLAYEDGRFGVTVYRSGLGGPAFEASGRKENVEAAKQTAIRVWYGFAQDEPGDDVG